MSGSGNVPTDVQTIWLLEGTIGHLWSRVAVHTAPLSLDAQYGVAPPQGSAKPFPADIQNYF